MIGQTISHYRITAKLGEGGMGAVYRAVDEKLQREVALKFLPPDLAADAEARLRLIKEAQAASRLNHPHIATVYEVNDTEATPFIAMELVKGESLKRRLQRGSVAPGALLEVARQIAEGLQEAHQAGVLHRDIKPANIMVDANGWIKILDFGIALLTGRQRGRGETEESFITRTATQASTGGTVPYMSPEQLRGEAADARSDVFSFGVLLYECLAGRLPFRGETSIDTLHAILHHPLTPLRQVVSDIPSGWEELVGRCLEKSPQQRLQSMAEVVQALKRLAAPASAAEKSLAVLYFENLSAAKEDEYFRDGITEDLITELSKIKHLRVFPRAAVVVFRNESVTGPEVGRQLNATYVLSGSLRRAGTRLRISAQLVETRTGHTVWAERYDREMQDVFELQDELARKISEALRITLSPQEERAIARKPTENSQAYDFYLRGRGYARRGTRADLEFAIELYDRAIGLDPKFALPYAGIGYACALILDWHDKGERWSLKGLEASERALALEPQLPEALVARARLCWVRRKVEESIEYARRAIERKPDCEGAYWTLGQAYFTSDRWQEAAELAERAVEAAGADYNVYVPYIMALERLGDNEQSRRLREAQTRALQQHLQEVPDDVRARILLASDLAAAGQTEAAASEIQKAVALRPNDANVLYNAACAYGLLQRKQDALELLQRAIRAGYANAEWIARDPDLTCLHGEAEFDRLIAEAKAKG
ncbi:MAG: protein kinase [Acidobacteria bacterium]|nr:protein kinase [Acidobacteriota bacterium]